MFSEQFPMENRGYQSTAIAAVAVVIASIHVPSSWTPELVDIIVEYGDSLHTDCARQVKPGSRNLSPSELLQIFVVGDVRARVKLRRNLTAGIVLEKDLLKALEVFFTSSKSGILHTSNLAVAVLQNFGKFYILDPTGRNKVNGSVSFDSGPATLIMCEDTVKMTRIFIDLCAYKEPTVYTLNALDVLDLKYFSK